MTALLAACALSALAIGQENRRTPVVEVVEKAGPAVVAISTEVVEDNPFRRDMGFDDPWRNFFFGQPRAPEVAQSLGSGVIIDKSGVVLTNEHVISRATRVKVTLRDRRSFDADVVAADPTFDIAVLRLKKAEKLPVVEIGTSSDLMPGETVVAIGNPFGLSNTVTTGVVSALHRSVPIGDRAYEDFVQIDAAINPGNSGGALLNIQGRLVGINTAIHGSGSGIGFAIPVDRALAVVDEVMRYGEVRPAFLGIFVDRSDLRGGAKVIRVDVDSPAHEAGVEPGDRIVDIGGQQIENPAAFSKVERALIPGQQITVRLQRGGQAMDVRIKIRELTLERAFAIGKARLGISVRSSPENLLIITDVAKNTSAARVGIKKGDYLLSIAGRPLRNVKEFEAICAAIRDADAVSIIIGRDRRQYYVTLKL